MDFQDLLFYTFILLLSYIITKKIIHKLYNLPPTPFPTIPISGHIHLLNASIPTHRALFNLSSKYGPVVGLQLGARRAVLVSSPSAAEDCLNHNDIIFANRPRVLGGKYLAYNYTNMLWASYGPLWRNQRKIASTEILSTHRLHLLHRIRADEVRILVRRIGKKTTGDGDRTVEIKPWIFESINNVMLRMIAGKRFYGEGTESHEATTFRAVLKELVNMGGAFTMGDFFPWFKYLGLNRRFEKKTKDVFVKMDSVFQALVDEHREKMEKGGEESEKKDKTLIEVLLNLQKSDPAFITEDIIKGLVQILLLAGTETSSSTLEWAISLLLNNTEILKKAQREIDEHVGHNRLFEESDLSDLPYLHCIINETLRMYPAAPVLPPHESTADCVVGGYRIPRGTVLFLNVWGIHNDPNIWEEPRVFKPERFESVKNDHKVGHKFFPFGSGRRACPGENLAVRVIGLILGSLIQCFNWERIGDEMVDMEEKVGLAMWKSRPLQVKFSPRVEVIKLIS